jgi:MYXO-CTERM domain-containing protein
MTKIVCTLIAAGSIVSGASAGIVTVAADSSKTGFTMHGGDREVTSLGFAGSSALMSGSSFTQWKNGRITNNVGTYGWNDLITRDMNTGGNAISANPDRADNASFMPDEGSGKGTLRDVFGEFNGYKNMSWIIDGEDAGSYTLDLFYGAGQFLNSDADNATMEISVLERGGNSDFRVYGIYADGSLTSGIFVNRNQTSRVGWTLNTLEIGDTQQVHGVGISFDDSWDGLVGVRIETTSRFNGPDLVAVGSGATVPTPGALAVMGLGVLVAGRRKR